MAGAVSDEANTVTIPADTAPGTYRVLVHADPDNPLTEASETNNLRATGPLVVTPPVPAPPTR